MSILIAAQEDRPQIDAWAAQLAALLPSERFVTRPEHEVEAAIVANPPIGALQGLPRLAFIQSMWAGVEKLLRDASVPVDIPIARMVDPAMNAAMAETALWAVLNLHRDYFAYVDQQRERRWQVLPQQRADEVVVAVLGLGEMGRAAAARLVAQGYRVRGWRTRAATLDGVETLSGDDALPALLAAADIVVNLLPLTPRTQGLFDAATLSRMKKGSSLVNLARGAHVVEADLLAALDTGHLHRAVLDVFATEPLPTDHAFWSHPRVTVLPHAAAQTDPRSALQVVADNLRVWREGRPVRHLVDRSRGY